LCTPFAGRRHRPSAVRPDDRDRPFHELPKFSDSDGRKCLSLSVDRFVKSDYTTEELGQDQTHPLRGESVHDASLHHEEPGTSAVQIKQLRRMIEHSYANNDMAQTEEMEFDLA
jgi:hypothetical protein